MGAVLNIMRTKSLLLLLILFVSLSPLLRAEPAAPWLSRTAPKSLYSADVPGRAPKLHGAPYVTQVTATSALVNWMVRVGPISVGESPEQLTTAATGWRVERVPLTGLKPGTTYYYDVLRDGSAEGRGQFTTAPRPGAPGDFSFIVYGDTRSRHDVHRLVANKIGQQEYDFAVHTGDLVADGGKPDMWPPFFENGQELLRKSAIFPALGNHERNSPSFYEVFNADRRGYYSFDWGNAHFAVINSDVNNYTATPEGREKYWNEQLQWLDKDLAAAAKADYRFVVFHHPPYTATGQRQQGSARIAEIVTPVIGKHKVSAVFSGHDHNFQHHVTGGVHYVVTGGGGAPLYETDALIPEVTIAAERVENFVVVRVNGKKASATAISLDGRTLDSFAMEAGGAAARTAAAGAGR